MAPEYVKEFPNLGLIHMMFFILKREVSFQRSRAAAAVERHLKWHE